MPSRRRLRTLNFGSEQAETDPLLEQAFYESRFYEGIESKTDPHRFIIGRTGSGKSALLKHLEETHPNHVIRIDPENLALNYLHDLGVVRDLAEREVHLDAFFNALWKHVLVVEIIRHRYKLDSPESKRQFLATLRERLRRDPAKRQALDYLDEFGENFWQETDLRVREITQGLENRLSVGGSAATPPLHGIEGGVHAGFNREYTDTEHSVETERLQRIINDTQVPRLNTMITVIDDSILASAQDYTYIIIDDLDREWADDELANDIIRCLFGAVLSLVKVRNLKIIVALRTNIFDHLNFGPRGGGQEEKYRDLAFMLRWQDWELIELADERTAAIGEAQGIPTLRSIRDILPVGKNARRTAQEYVLSRTLMRPRDVISFLNIALEMAGGRTRLSWSHLYRAEQRHSNNRLMGLRDEWKPTFPGIERLFELFRGAPITMNPDEVEGRLSGIEPLLSDSSFVGENWLFDLASPMWDHNMASSGQRLQRILQLLYDIGFLGIGADANSLTYCYEELGLADSPLRLDEAS